MVWRVQLYTVQLYIKVKAGAGARRFTAITDFRIGTTAVMCKQLLVAVTAVRYTHTAKNGRATARLAGS